MTSSQKVIRYCAIALAIFLAVGIIGGILNAIDLLMGLGSNDAVLEDLKTYEVSSDVTSLEVLVSASDFYIKEGDEISVESNLKNLEVREKNNKLIIEDKTKITTSFENAVLILYVPDTAWEEAIITAGAGRFTAETLCADTLKLELGAGEVNIKNISVTSNTRIEGGAGAITVSDGELHNLDMNMGVGQLNLSCSVTGDGKLNLGVGESNITLLNEEDDLSVNVEKGLGNLNVNGKDLSKYSTDNNSKDSLEIHGGVGAINLKTSEGNNK
ncbi:MAG: DUF4097 family beta strand repeat protein [Ruminococcus sp.]|nr:DUF4097 family beta strand repeat protein [Ruminococcus sp.]